MDDYLSKPFRPNALYEVLAKHLLDKAATAPDIARPLLSPTVASPAPLRTSGEGVPLFDEALLLKVSQLYSTEPATVLGQLVPLFLKQIDRFTKLFAQHIEAADVAGIKSIAHTLKSSASHVGLSRLSHAMNELESLCETRTAAEAIEHARRLLPLFDFSRETLAQWLMDHQAQH